MTATSRRRPRSKMDIALGSLHYTDQGQVTVGCGRSKSNSCAMNRGRITSWPSKLTPDDPDPSKLGGGSTCLLSFSRTKIILGKILPQLLSADCLRKSNSKLQTALDTFDIASLSTTTMPPRLQLHLAHLAQPVATASIPTFLVPFLHQQSRNASILASLSDVPAAYNKKIRRGRGPSSGIRMRSSNSRICCGQVESSTINSG